MKAFGNERKKILNKNTIDHTLEYGEFDVFLLETLAVQPSTGSWKLEHPQINPMTAPRDSSTWKGTIVIRSSPIKTVYLRRD